MNLVFLHNEANENEGLGDAGIETYRDTPYASTARECGQNSMDAARDNPVIVHFDLIHVPKSEIPCHEKLESALMACLGKARDQAIEKEVDFFDGALATIRNDSIEVLRISDFNTKGLLGPAVPGRPFHSLVKATGVSTKEQETSGGSFGIGKNAVFSISNLQTVFYSTLYLDETTGDRKYLAQGKSILVSHIDGGGTPRRARGYWGGEGFNPLDFSEAVPGWLQRDEVGTSVYAVGFAARPDWQYRMVQSLVRNFFSAIHNGLVEFRITGNGDELRVTKATLPSLFTDAKVRDASEVTGHLEELEFAKYLYDALISTETRITEIEVEGLGKVAVRLLVKDGLPKRVCIARNGMVITDTLEHFGDKFRNFPMYKEFVALVEPITDAGSTLIKQLENPRHDSLSAERILDKGKRDKATRVMKSLAKKIREVIKTHTLTVPEDVEKLDELAEYFANPETSDAIPGSVEGDQDLDSHAVGPIVTKPVKRRSRATSGEGDAGGAGGRKRNGGGGGSGSGTGKGSGQGGQGDRAYEEPVELWQMRNRIEDAEGQHWRRIFFTPAVSGTIRLTLMASGTSEPEPIDVSSADPGVVEGGKVVLEVKEGERTELRVLLGLSFDGPIELGATTIAREGNSSESQ